MCFGQGVGGAWGQWGKFEGILDQIQGAGGVKYLTRGLAGQLQIIFLNSDVVKRWAGGAGVGDEIVDVEEDG